MSSPRKQSPVTIDLSLWDRSRGRILAGKGGWVPTKGLVYSHGYSLLTDLVGKKSFFEVLVLNVTGRLPEPRLAQWLEGLFLCLSWPDARIWCNQVGALAGTMGTSPVAAVAAGVLASDSRMYGPGVMMACVRFIDEALSWHQGEEMCGAEIIVRYQERVKKAVPQIPGYRRPVPQNGAHQASPLSPFDERVSPMKRLAHRLGYQVGPRLRLAHKIHAHMRQSGGAINLAGYAAAFLRDAGFTPAEICRLLSTWVHAGVQACYAEAAERPAGTFYPLRCKDVGYQGTPPRPVPE